MKNYIYLHLCKQLLLGITVAGIMLVLGCSKESALEPSLKDSNYFVNKDNPNDPVDHAIFKFYERTGIASFYSDTIHKKLVSKPGELPERYTYVTLSFSYHPLGDKSLVVTPLSSKDRLPALLELIENEVLPRLPSTAIIPSLLFLDGYKADWLEWDHGDVPLSYGWTSIYGFNTVGVIVKDVSVMSPQEKRMYAASFLAGIAEKRINNTEIYHLKENFYSISRSLMQNVTSYDVYSGYPWFVLSPALPPSFQIPTPKSIGLFHYPVMRLVYIDLQIDLKLDFLPTESTDLRSYLTAAFFYDPQEFSSLFGDYHSMTKKYDIVREVAQKTGFKLPD